MLAIYSPLNAVLLLNVLAGDLKPLKLLILIFVWWLLIEQDLIYACFQDNNWLPVVFIQKKILTVEVFAMMHWVHYIGAFTQKRRSWRRWCTTNSYLKHETNPTTYQLGPIRVSTSISSIGLVAFDHLPVSMRHALQSDTSDPTSRNIESDRNGCSSLREGEGELGNSKP